MIHAADLSMHYGPRVALEGASFDVEPGQVVGLLGPNGAGKSTTMKILTTYLYPTRGSATVGGKSVRNEPLAVRRLIGYLPEVLPVYPEMRAGAYLNFVGRARGLRGARLRQRRAWVEERCGLEGVDRHLIRELSKGYQQRLGLAQALIHDPQVVILDEPTSSLDPTPDSGGAATRLGPRQRRQDRAALHPHSARGRGHRRPSGHHQPGAHRRQRHAGGLAARLRQYERTSLSVAAPREAVESALQSLPGLLEVRPVHASDVLRRVRRVDRRRYGRIPATRQPSQRQRLARRRVARAAAHPGGNVPRPHRPSRFRRGPRNPCWLTSAPLFAAS